MNVPTYQLSFAHNGSLPTGVAFYRAARQIHSIETERLFNFVDGKQRNRPANIRLNCSPHRLDIFAIDEEAIDWVKNAVPKIEELVFLVAGKKLPTNIISAVSRFTFCANNVSHICYGLIVAHDGATCRQWIARNEEQKKDRIKQMLTNGLRQQLQQPNLQMDIDIISIGESSPLLRCHKPKSSVIGLVIQRVNFTLNANLTGSWAAGFNTAMGCGAIRQSQQS